MKKLISLTFAVVSTTFLFVGATQAAEKFDILAQSSAPSISGKLSEDQAPPCIVVPDKDPEQSDQTSNPE